ncbi:MAG TPA: hypothetical protein VGX92_17675 [Pyrinomonadaceae bacterium]|jgi:hypothetical protein|nr:hypothetical protein [Pyrinomonadaceae bacterium]
MRLGVSGHQRLKDQAAWGWVASRITEIVRGAPASPVGVTSLAIGADQLFANIILEHQGTLEVIKPFAEYGERFAAGRDRQEYERLLQSARKVETLQKKGSDEEAYLEAGKRVVELAELLIAVWDEKPAAGLGGTADTVNYAIKQRTSIILLNPILRRVRNL